MSKVLVVDDEETIRILVQAHLKQTGHLVLTASSAEEALSVGARAPTGGESPSSP